MFIRRDKTLKITLRLSNLYLTFNSNLYKYYNVLTNLRFNYIVNIVIKKACLTMSIVVK